MLDSSTEITVVVKAPNQQHSDHEVRCYYSWTVLRLKTHLTQNYPSKPTLSEQRLIYAGQLLLDDVRLGDVLRPHPDRSSVHTVHLVCLPAPSGVSGTNRSSGGSTAARETELRHRRPQTTQAAEPAAPVPQTPAAPVPPAVAVAAQAAEAPMPQPYDLGRWAQLLQQQYQHQQHAALHHAYSHYWLQYAQMMQMHAGGPLPMVWPQPVPVHTVPDPTGTTPAPPQAHAHIPAPPQQQQPPPEQRDRPRQDMPQNIRLDAQGGVVADDEDGMAAPWDWLDWLHGLARLSILFLAVYLYASVSRLVLVLFFGFIAYLYNQGWFHQEEPPRPPAAEQQREQRQQQAAGEQQQQQDGNEDELPDRDPAQQDQDSDESDSTPAPLQEPPRPHPLTLAGTFIRAFFASLIPDRIPQ